MTSLADLAVRLWGRTPAEARAEGRCLRCWLPVALDALPDLDRREYTLSALCPACFDEIMEAPDE